MGLSSSWSGQGGGSSIHNGNNGVFNCISSPVPFSPTSCSFPGRVSFSKFRCVDGGINRYRSVTADGRGEKVLYRSASSPYIRSERFRLTRAREPLIGSESRTPLFSGLHARFSRTRFFERTPTSSDVIGIEKFWLQGTSQ